MRPRLAWSARENAIGVVAFGLVTAVVGEPWWLVFVPLIAPVWAAVEWRSVSRFRAELAARQPVIGDEETDVVDEPSRSVLRDITVWGLVAAVGAAAAAVAPITAPVFAAYFLGALWNDGRRLAAVDRRQRAHRARLTSAAGDSHERPQRP